MSIAVAGAGGFIGSALRRCAAQRRVDITTVAAIRLPPVPRPKDPLAVATAHSASGAYAELVTALRGHRTVVNAAGAARPASGDVAGLRAANVAWPLLLSLACAEAGVQRLVHLSSAAVQGRMDPLDETLAQRAFSAYSASKAEAESRLVDLHLDQRGPAQLCLYRPTSVQGHGRTITASLRRLKKLRRLPLHGDGSQPLPLSHVDNVAAAALHLANAEGEVPLVALHPWEGLTTAMLYDFVAPGRRTVSLPTPVVRTALAGGRLAGRFSPRLQAGVRHAELLFDGQTISAQALARVGFSPPAGMDQWRRLLAPPD